MRRYSIACLLALGCGEPVLSQAELDCAAHPSHRSRCDEAYWQCRPDLDDVQGHRQCIQDLGLCVLRVRLAVAVCVHDAGEADAAEIVRCRALCEFGAYYCRALNYGNETAGCAQAFVTCDDACS